MNWIIIQVNKRGKIERFWAWTDYDLALRETQTLKEEWPSKDFGIIPKSFWDTLRNIGTYFPAFEMFPGLSKKE